MHGGDLPGQGVTVTQPIVPWEERGLDNMVQIVG